MSFRFFLKRCLMEYFIITTFTTAAIGILGLILNPGERFGYEAYFSPLLFGCVSLLPSLVTYSRKELTFRQMLLRKGLHLIVLEGTLIVFGFAAGLLHGLPDASLFGCTVFIVYAAVHWISWQLEKKQVVEINATLKSFQDRSE